MNLLIDKITFLEQNKSESINDDQTIRKENQKLQQIIHELNQKIEKQNSDESIQVNAFFPYKLLLITLPLSRN
jgi:hypothetical protein